VDTISCQSEFDSDIIFESMKLRIGDGSEIEGRRGSTAVKIASYDASFVENEHIFN
jgi:hypothetical protein